MPPKVFVSFDYENDKHYKFLLEAWSKNKRFDFVFDDHSSKEIQSYDVARVKAALTSKIKGADCTLVIIGRYANALHRQSLLIGYRNWINFEIARSIASGNKIIAVKLDRDYKSPEELLRVNAEWIFGFSLEKIAQAIGKVTFSNVSFYR